MTRFHIGSIVLHLLNLLRPVNLCVVKSFHLARLHGNRTICCVVVLLLHGMHCDIPASSRCQVMKTFYNIDPLGVASA